MIMDARKAKYMSAFAIILFFAGFGFLIWIAVMQEYGLSNTVTIAMAILGFFGCDILSVILLFKAFPGIVAWDIERIDKKYDERELLVFSHMGKDVVAQKLLGHKFKYSEGGYYQKREFAPLKDYICYYIRIVDAANLENTVQSELNRFDAAERKGKNFCLILLVYLDELGEAERVYIKEIGKRLIAMEAINPYVGETVIVAAIDNRTNEGYCLDVGAGKIFTLYSYGYRLLKKISRK